MMIRAFCQDERGATAVEYSLLALLITVAVAASMSVIGPALTKLMEKVAGYFARV